MGYYTETDRTDSAGVVLAAVDIGTNTLKLTVANCLKDDTITVLADRAETVRLGAGIESSGRIDDERGRRAIGTLKAFEEIGLNFGAVSWVGVATEALRIADNGAELLERIARETRWKISIISGDEEARLTFLGLRNLLPEVGPAAIVDIGGGSTEWISVENQTMLWSKSLALGSGRLADRYLVADPPGHAAVNEAVEAARIAFASQIASNRQRVSSLRLSGGNGQYIDQIRASLRFADCLDASVVRRVLDYLMGATSGEVAALLNIPQERARVLPAGVAIAIAAIEMTATVDLIAVPSGIRTGLLRELVAQSLRPAS